MLHYLDKDTFKPTVDGNSVVLVDFYADWCAPCKALHPTLEALDEKYGDKVIIAKVNVDENPELAAEFSVRSIPALFYFKDGQVSSSQNGALSQAAISEKLDAIL